MAGAKVTPTVRILREILDELKQHRGLLNEHSDILREQGGILREHGGILREHGGILREHSDILREHGGILREHGGILREHSGRFEAIERRQTETEIRLSTEIVAVAGAVREVRDLLRERLDDRGRVDDHEVRIQALERASSSHS